MAKLSGGINDGFSGKVGTVVGLKLNGQNIMRSAPRKSSKQASVGQLAQREKLKVVSGFLKHAKEIIDQWFGIQNANTVRSNKASSYHMREAIVPDGDGFRINYKRVLFTLGDLIGPQQAAAVAGNNNSIEFTWGDNSDIAQARPNDKMLAVVYDESGNRLEYRMTALREDLSFQMTLPQDWSGATLHCWISFIAEDGSRWSTGCYLGEVVV